MGWFESVFGALLIVIYVGWHQVLSLRRLRQTPNLSGEEQHYERRKAQGRLLSSGLLLVLAALLTTLLVFYELPAGEIAAQRAGLDKETAPPPTAEEAAFLRVWGWLWITFLLVLTAVLLLAAIDLLSTRQFGLRQFRKLQADRRAMIERQARRMRQERNGHG